MAEALTNQAYEYLYDKIVSCQYPPGQELNEKQLLEQTKFGRTPLREALLMLQSDKLVGITDNQILMNMYHSVMIHQLRLAVYAAMLDASSRNDNLRQHKAIIDALLRENEEDVQDAVVLHINHSLIKALKLLRNSGKE